MKTCIICNTVEPGYQWYRGPKCSYCYQKNHYKSEARKFGFLQKYQRCQFRIRQRKLEFDLSKEDYKIIIDQGCYYCGKNLYKETGHSLDRIDSTKGYTKNNVLPCCGDCNTIRFNLLTVKETKEVINFIKTLRNTDMTPWER